MRKEILAAALLTTLAAAPAVAQGGFTVGFQGGATLPMGDLADAVKTGFGGGVTLMMRNPSSKVGFGIEAQLHRHSYKELFGTVDPDVSLNSYGAMARLDFAAGNAFYLLGGAGLFRLEVTGGDDLPDFGDTSNTNFAVEAGAGFNFGPGLFIEGKLINIFTEDSNTRMIPLTVGIRF